MYVCRDWRMDVALKMCVCVCVCVCADGEKRGVGRE